MPVASRTRAKAPAAQSPRARPCSLDRHPTQNVLGRRSSVQPLFPCVRRPPMELLTVVFETRKPNRRCVILNEGDPFRESEPGADDYRPVVARDFPFQPALRPRIRFLLHPDHRPVVEPMLWLTLVASLRDARVVCGSTEVFGENGRGVSGQIRQSRFRRAVVGECGEVLGAKSLRGMRPSSRRNVRNSCISQRSTGSSNSSGSSRKVRIRPPTRSQLRRGESSGTWSPYGSRSLWRPRITTGMSCGPGWRARSEAR